MNGRAEQVIIGVGLSNRFSLKDIEELYEGIENGCETFKVDLVGGDTSSSAQGLVISVTVIGVVEKSKITFRKGGKESDILMVSGDLGRAYLGLQILEREKSVFLSNPSIQPELDSFELLIKKQLMPVSRMDVIDFFEQLEVIPTSMIDISDGLGSELLHLCHAGNVGCRIYEEKLPIHEESYLMASQLNLSPITCAMNGGEEYELLFSVGQAEYPKIQGNPYFTPIGYFTKREEGSKLLDKNLQEHEILAQGWRHF